MKRTQQVLPLRQRVRRAVLLVMLFGFPVTIYYFSPVLSLVGATQRIVTGSVVVFALQFVSALFLGRAFCGWVCPAGAVQEAVIPVRPTRFTTARWIKFAIWVPWVAFLIYSFATTRGTVTIDMDAFTTGGVSVTDAAGYIVYYAVLTAFVVPSLILGRRGGCHTLCWMAPFMILGAALGRRLRLPALHLRTTPEQCVHCSSCTSVCPMSLEVERLAVSGSMAERDCIVCGECVDVCPQNVISYGFGRPHDAREDTRVSSAR